jgi:acetolactate synthase-1/2/3 large subunit
MIKVSDYIFDFLKSKEINTIFSVAGGAAAHLLNSVAEGKYSYICNYNEQACTMAAEGYARIANKPAIVLVTNGPGSSNAITGVLGAYQDSIPMIILSGQVPVKQTLGSLNNISLRQLGVQECDIISMVTPITKYAVQVTDPKDIQYHLSRAYHEAITGRQGPVWLDIPLDVQNALIEFNPQNEFIPDNQEQELIDYDKVINEILKAKRPLIVTGNGIHLSNSEELFLELKQQLQIPIVSTWTSKDLLDQEDKLFVGNFGILGERAANFAIQNADLLLVLGSRLSIPNIGYQSHLFSPNSIKVVVDIDLNELQKPTIKIQHPIHCDLKVFIDELTTRLATKNIPSWSPWTDITHKWKQTYPVFQSEYKENKHKINSYYFMEVLSKQLTDNSIVVTDMGTSYTCTMQSLRMNGKNRLFTSSACCSMGFGLPGAIGAYIADPTKDIILIAGDGGIQMNLQELQTISHYNIPIKMFILNNNGYLAISLMQDNLFNGNYIGSNKQSGVSAPDFIKIANAYGFTNYKFNTNEQLIEGIGEALSKEGPVLVEITMPENQLLIPRVQSSKDENGNILSTSLEHMFPYLPAEEMKQIML